MSPPQVYLSVKPTAVVSDEELPTEKKDKTDTDSIITIETKGKGNCCNCCKSNRHCRIICCIVALAVVAGTIAVVLGVKFGLRHHDRQDYVDYVYPPFRCGTQDHFYEDYEVYDDKNCTSWSCLYGEDRITENVWVEEDLQLIHAEHTHGSHEEPSMHILHDYQNSEAAYKDTERYVCYITPLRETFQQGLNRWHSYERTGREPRTLRLLSDRRIEPEELELSVSVYIYKHCMDAQSFWAEEIEERNVESNMTIVKV